MYASLHQRRCHAILKTLRASSSGYRVPEGDWFSSISCPHYTAELLIYFALALILQTTIGALPLVCTSLNLSFTARNTHEWYRRKFEDYPPERRWAIIPYVL